MGQLFQATIFKLVCGPKGSAIRLQGVWEGLVFFFTYLESERNLVSKMKESTENAVKKYNVNNLYIKY